MKQFINYFINYLENLFTPVPFTGVNEDTRSQEEKDNDPLHPEVAGGMIVTWTEKPASAWKHVSPVRSQPYSAFDCVAFSNATGTQADHNFPVALSARDIYARRSNFPEEGMIPQEGLKIVTEHGIIPESMLTSDGLSETQLNQPFTRTPDMNTAAQQTKGGIPVTIPNPDIDTVASVIAQGYAVRLCFQFSEQEWQEIPQDYGGGSIRHEVIAVDYTLYAGTKFIVIQDSCFPISQPAFAPGLRLMSAKYFTSDRCFFAGYIKPQSVVPSVPAPVHTFTIQMGLGDQTNEVYLLQQKLISLGLLTVAPTGYFGGLTRQAIQAFQTSHGIPTTGYVGPLTLKALNM